MEEVTSIILIIIAILSTLSLMAVLAQNILRVLKESREANQQLKAIIKKWKDNRKDGVVTEQERTEMENEVNKWMQELEDVSKELSTIPHNINRVIKALLRI